MTDSEKRGDPIAEARAVMRAAVTGPLYRLVDSEVHQKTGAPYTISAVMGPEGAFAYGADAGDDERTAAIENAIVLAVNTHEALLCVLEAACAVTDEACHGWEGIDIPADIWKRFEEATRLAMAALEQARER